MALFDPLADIADDRAVCLMTDRPRIYRLLRWLIALSLPWGVSGRAVYRADISVSTLSFKIIGINGRKISDRTFELKSKYRIFTIRVLPPSTIISNPKSGAIALSNGDGSGQIYKTEIISIETGKSLASTDAISRFVISKIDSSGCSKQPQYWSVFAERWLSDTAIILRVENWERSAKCRVKKNMLVKMQVPN